MKNFAEASGELIEELKETLDEVRESMDEEQGELIDEICQDLTENLSESRVTGDRADRIVRDMLADGPKFRRAAADGDQQPARRARSSRFPQCEGKR